MSTAGFGRAGPELDQDALQVLARDGVEGAERLVEEKDGGIGGERACQADALLHAAESVHTG
jgi:hypothetical protein